MQNTSTRLLGTGEQLAFLWHASGFFKSKPPTGGCRFPQYIIYSTREIHLCVAHGLLGEALQRHPLFFFPLFDSKSSRWHPGTYHHEPLALSALKTMGLRVLVSLEELGSIFSQAVCASS